MKVTHPAVFSLAGYVQKPAQHTGGGEKRKKVRKEGFIKNTTNRGRKERKQYLLLNTKPPVFLLAPFSTIFYP